MQPIVLTLAAIGALTLLYAALRLGATLYQYCVYSFCYAPYKREWAVVTGASGDIGGAFVHALAKRGLNVLLIARSVQNMNAVASEAQQQYGVSTEVHAFDFENASEHHWQTLRQLMSSKTPTVLINNVGISLEMPTELIDVPEQLMTRMVNINIHSTNRITKMVLPHMLSVRKGIILCLASGGGAVTPAPMLTPYAGTKAYNDAFAVSLNGELHAHNIHVHSLTPFFVAGSMAKMRRSLTVPSPSMFAEKALQQVALTPRLNPYWPHQLMGAAVRALPLAMQTRRVYALHRSIRARALRKKARAAKQH